MGLESLSINRVAALIIISLVLFLAGCSDEDKVDVFVNGKTLSPAGELQNNRVFVAVHPLAEALGLSVSYDPNNPNQGVIIQQKGRFVFLSVNSLFCHVDDRTPALGAAVVYIHPDTSLPMVPAQFVAETFGATVERKPASGRKRESLYISLPR